MIVLKNFENSDDVFRLKLRNVKMNISLLSEKKRKKEILQNYRKLSIIENQKSKIKS